MRSTWARTAVISSGSGDSGLTTPAVTASPSWRTRTPTVCQLPSAGNASSRAASCGPLYAAGVKPSRKRMLDASENGPRGTRVNVCMNTI